MSKKQDNNEQINNFTIEKAIDNIDDKDNKKVIYKALWENNDFFKNKNIKVQKVFYPRYSVYSKNSYAFQIEDGKGNIIENKNISKNDIFKYIYEKLIKLFGITNKKRFEEKLSEVCGGSGSEQRNITKLHSSSLCALLFFYNVSDKNTLTLKIDSKEIIFKDVLFEFQNIVIEGRKPSNVDVVLFGKDNDGKKVILFLESKFSEYLDVSKQFDLGLDYLEKYSNIYNDDNLKNINLCIYRENGIPKVVLKNKKGKIEKYNRIRVIKDADAMYIEGIKQIISHYIGINNLLSGNLCKNNTEKLKELYDFLSDDKKENYTKKELKKILNDDNTKIYLGEILFDFYNMNINDKEDFEEDFNNYCEKYKSLSEILNPLNNKIKVLARPFKYSLFKDNEHKIEKKIKEYYKL